MSSDHAKDIQFLRKLRIDYLRAHHDLLWELHSKEIMASWNICSQYEVWVLNSVVSSYVEASIRTLNIIKKMDCGSVGRGNLAHQFLREWRNLYHHEEIILFKPIRAKTSLQSNEKGEIGDFPAKFYTFLVIDNMRRIENPKNGLKEFLKKFDIASNGQHSNQASTLGGAVASNHAFLMNSLIGAYQTKLKSLPPGGVSIPTQEFISTKWQTSTQTVLDDAIWTQGRPT